MAVTQRHLLRAVAEVTNLPSQVAVAVTLHHLLRVVAVVISLPSQVVEVVLPLHLLQVVVEVLVMLHPSLMEVEAVAVLLRHLLLVVAEEPSTPHWIAMCSD